MKPPQLDILRQNAYRILGLPSSATQIEIESAARLMRLMGQSSPPATSPDVPWLGPLNRSPTEIERAATLLAHPETRLAQRLWWFWHPPATPAIAIRSITVEAVHDQLLVDYISFLQASKKPRSLPEWRALLQRFHALSESFFLLNVPIEQHGEFEIPATFSEIDAALRQFTATAAAALLPLASDLIDSKSWPMAMQCVALFAEFGHGPDARDRLLDRVENEFVAYCVCLRKDVDDAWDARNMDALKGACWIARREVDSELLPWITAFSGHLPLERERIDRLNATAALLLELVAKAYEACFDKLNAMVALGEAQALARGGIVEGRITQHLETVREQVRTTRNQEGADAQQTRTVFQEFLPFLLYLIPAIILVLALSLFSQKAAQKVAPTRPTRATTPSSQPGSSPATAPLPEFNRQ